MSRTLDQQRYRAEMLEALDLADERKAEASATDQRPVDMFVDMAVRFRHARAAFTGMTWEEFNALTASRARAGKRGRRTQSLEERDATPVARAARDVARLSDLWAASGRAGEPPVSHLELAAARHSVGEDELFERVRRPKSRNPHRLIEGS